MDGDSSQQQPGATGHWQYKPGDTSDAGAPEQGDPRQTTAIDQTPMPHPDDFAQAPQPNQLATAHDETVTWSASEFIAHQKSVGWYALLMLVTAVVAALVLLVTHDKISTGVVILVGIVFGIAAARKPRTLGYRIDKSGLNVGEQHYDYGQFRSFAVVDEDAFSSIIFMPLKRFMPLLTVYYDPKDEDKIVTILSERLPIETHKLDVIDSLMRRIRF